MTKFLLGIITIIVLGTISCQHEQASEDTSKKDAPTKLYPGLISTEKADENVLSFNAAEDLLFFTRGTDWIKQLPFVSKKEDGQFTQPQQIEIMDTIYNGAISPSGTKIIYCKRLEEETQIWLIENTNGVWINAQNLTEGSGISGGYFNWLDENEIYFYVDENEGDIVKGVLKDGKLEITEKLDVFNTPKGTEFSPFVDPQKRYFIFTRYLEGDKDQQGFFISLNLGNSENPIWETPRKIENLPYGWGAFVSKNGKQFFFSDGVDLFEIPFQCLVFS